jgi:hypothetical protein
MLSSLTGVSLPSVVRLAQQKTISKILSIFSQRNSIIILWQGEKVNHNKAIPGGQFNF